MYETVEEWLVRMRSGSGWFKRCCSRALKRSSRRRYHLRRNQMSEEEKTKRSGANPVPIFRFVLSRDLKSA